MLVREHVLGQELFLSPVTVPHAPQVTAGVSTRERLSEHEVNATCAACHVMMDPIGFAFENYDGIGRYRTIDGGKPIDTSGNLTGSDVNGTFTGVAQLGAKLAASPAVEACFGKQWFRYAMGRAERNVDACSLQAVAKTF